MRIALLAAVAFGILLLASCNFMFVGCNTTCNQHPATAREWPSPDGKLKILEQRYDCPGWYSLSLDIPTAGVAFTDRPAAQKRPPEWPDLKVEWKSDRELWITYPPGQDTTCMAKAGQVEVHCLDASLGSTRP